MKTENVNNGALTLLQSAKHRLSKQQYRTLRGQILAGDASGAIKGLGKILRRRDGYHAKVTIIDEMHKQKGADNGIAHFN